MFSLYITKISFRCFSDSGDSGVSVIQVFQALISDTINVLNTSTAHTEHRGTQFCASAIKIFKALKNSMIKVLDTSIKGGKHDEDTKISNLPTFVIWNIKDRLDFPDSLRIASVCKGWREASLSYTKDVRFREDSQPWIMLRGVRGGGAESDFTNLSTGKKCTVFNEDFGQPDSKILFSKQGWFLLHTKFNRKRNSFYVDEKGMGDVFLLNPFTNKKIELPSRIIFLHVSCGGAFAIKDGKPDLVVLAAHTPYEKYKRRYGCIRLWGINCAGKQNSWREHTYEPLVDIISVVLVEIIGQKVYIVSGTQIFLLFSLLSSEWTPVEQSWGDSIAPYVVENDDGEVWKFHSHDETFYKLNDGGGGWKQVKAEDYDLMCFFLKGSSKGYSISKFVFDDADELYRYLKHICHVNYKTLYHQKLNVYDLVSIVLVYTIEKGTNAEWVDMP